MLIDWFTVIAQVVNFLVLVWLLKRFLYAPILSAIDAREKRIAAELADAAAKKEAAHRERDEFRHKNEEFAQQRMALMSAATLEARTERQRLLEEARKEAEELRAGRQEAMRKDFRNLSDEIVRRSREEVFAIARKTLGDLAAASLEEHMVEAFIRRCRTLGEEERAALRAAFKAAAGPALVCSTFALPAAQQKAMERSARELFAYEGKVQFETSPELVSGITLSLNGYEVAWNIADYLLALEQQVGDLLGVEAPAEDREKLNPGEAEPASQAGPQPAEGAGGHG